MKPIDRRDPRGSPIARVATNDDPRIARRWEAVPLKVVRPPEARWTDGPFAPPNVPPTKETRIAHQDAPPRAKVARLILPIEAPPIVRRDPDRAGRTIDPVRIADPRNVRWKGRGVRNVLPIADPQIGRHGPRKGDRIIDQDRIAVRREIVHHARLKVEWRIGPDRIAVRRETVHHDPPRKQGPRPALLRFA